MNHLEKEIQVSKKIKGILVVKEKTEKEKKWRKGFCGFFHLSPNYI